MPTEYKRQNSNRGNYTQENLRLTIEAVKSVGKRKRRSSPNSDEEEDIEVQYEEESDIPSVIDETECTGCRESYNSTRKGND
ncbi:hypothetical protein ILUMI_16203 [Ignelater luminosus]|uniref:Uncharacterized protein n=1 Tax=Ignelater luminosus TaxID=2038154 RepID=A0A8K0CMA3_IGNLU|nr:hypothetical protein ILUMI_16203 [Ignelater luminosus]